VAIVGTGSTGIQLAQELSKVAGQLTVFQRTPNMSLPMGQVDYDLPNQAIPRSKYPALFVNRKDHFSGFSCNSIPCSTFEDTPEQRLKVYEELWKEGDFKFWLATYYDMLFTKEGNREAYDFWPQTAKAERNTVVKCITLFVKE
jgi:cation diffusion facilitator CzcD-associated flavoprotein CzcO